MSLIRITLFLLLVLTLPLACSSQGVAGFMVDGDLSEWGIEVKDGGSVWEDTLDNALQNSPVGTINLGTGIGMGFEYVYHLEDFNDGSNSGLLGPNYGGQNYDAEFLGIADRGSSYIIAIVTGQNTANGVRRYSPGDIYIETEFATIYGIEVGGAFEVVNKVFTGSPGSVVEMDAGATFNVEGSGYTDEDDPYLLTDSRQKAGSVWRTVASDWRLDPIPVQERVQLQMDVNDPDSQRLGFANYIYTNVAEVPNYYDGSQHAIIELEVSKDFFNGSIQMVRWAPSCGNDFVQVDVPPGGLPVVPEPSSFALLGMGAFSLLGLRRRRKTELSD